MRLTPHPAPARPAPLAALCAAALVVAAGCAPAAPPAEDRPAPREAAVALTGPALDAPIRFRPLDVPGGPGERWVTALFQDALGFLWVATDDGVFRYDGAAARAFHPAPFDTTSLSDPWVNALVPDGRGGFWATTESGGLHRYGAGLEAFERYPDVAPDRTNGVARDGRGVVWASTDQDGVVRYDPASGAVRSLTAAEDGLPDDRTGPVLYGPGGDVWVGLYGGGVARIDPSTSRVRAYRPAPGGLPAGRVWTLYADAEGGLWVGAVEGVGRYDASADAFAAVPFDGDDDPERRDVSALLRDPDGLLWVGSEAGLARVDPETGRSAVYRHDPTDPTSVGAGPVSALLMDRGGVVWVGTESGAYSFEWAAPPFELFAHDPDDPNSLDGDNVYAVYEDADGVLWVGTTVGLNRVDRASDRVTRYAPDPADPGALASRLVMGITETEDGAFWVSTRTGGLHRFDRATGRVVERFGGRPLDPDGLYAENPWWITEDRRGRTWITAGGAGCLHLADLDAGAFTPLCHDPDDPATPAEDFGRYLIEARDGVLWYGSWGGGLDRIDPETGAFTHYRHDPADHNTPSDDDVMFVGEGEGGVLWLGTYGSGFSRFDPATETFTHWTTADSDLPSNVVYGIQPDDDGDLWLSTNAGIVRFGVADESFQSFGPADGVQALEFNSGASFRSASGELFFGGVAGLNAFYPDRVRDNPVAPPVAVTAVAVEGRRAEPGGALDAAAPLAERVRLAPGERDLAVSFAALHYANPARNEYRYRLDGYDADWRRPEGDPEAVYTNLDPGRYTLRVQAANADGVWNREGATLAVVVAPRFYQTWWFALLVALMLVGGAVALVRQRVAGQRAREAELRATVAERTEALRAEKATTEAQADQLRELDRAKSRFFANVSHEFRTPLTLTIGPLEDLRDGVHGELGGDARETVGLALRSARRVMTLINQILDVAKLDAQRVRLQARPLDLGATVGALADAFAPLAERLGVALDLDRPARPVEVWADPDALDKVLSNLLSNAFKFTPGGGAVRLAVAVETAGGDGYGAGGGEAVVTVADTGPGVAPEHLPHLFDRFYQADGATVHRRPGTGIGLALAHELAALHGGTLAVESAPGEGSAFTLRLPLGRDHLGPDQVAPEGAAPPEAEVWADRVDDVEADAPPVSDPDDGEDRTTVLVVDDHAGIRAYLRRHLEGDYRVVEAADGAEALAVARERLPDLVVSDVMMPVMDGVALCRALKQDPATDFVPVVLLTAKAGEEATLAGLDALADDYVTKPFNVREVRARVENLIRQRRRLRERWSAVSGDGHADEPVPPPAPPAGDDGSAEDDPERAALRAAVREAVEAHLADEDFGVDALAAAVGLSRSSLYRRLGDGPTPNAILREARLARGARLLEGGAGTVSEVAYAVGFRSVSHFSRAFREEHGVPPSAYAERGA